MINIRIIRCLRTLTNLTKTCENHLKSCCTFHCSANRERPDDSKWSYGVGPATEPLWGITLGQVAQRAADKFGDDESLVSCHQNIKKTFTQTNQEAKDLAAAFLAIGFKPGDRIGIWGPNSYEWYLTFFAAAKAGLILVNINPSYQASELEYCLKKVRVTGLVCADKFKTTNYYELLRSILPELDASVPGGVGSKNLEDLKIVITMSDQKLNGAYNFKDLLNAGGSEQQKKVDELESDIQFDDPFNIQFTSGTTGEPKAALLSHHNISNNAYFLGKRCEYDTKKPRVCLSVPLFHCFGSVIGATSNAFFGGATVLPSDGFDAAAIVKCLEEHRITSCYGTPTMFVDILKEFEKNPVKIDHLHTGVMAGAPCPEELCVSVINQLNMKDFMVMYGMTETSPVSFQCFPTDSIAVRSSTIGFPSSHVEVKIVDEQGKVVPRGTPGELYVRGYPVFLGYWGDEEKTKETITSDRWLKSGDLVVMNEDGYAFVAGRLKDVVIRGGENIYPAEVENFFMGHPEVMEAQAFGVPDSRMGEEMALWVRLDTDSKIDSKNLKAWAKGKIAHYKIPRYILFKDSFPKTVSGKVQKFKLKEETIKELNL